VSDDALAGAINIIKKYISSGDTIESARKTLRMLIADEEIINAAINEVNEEAKKIRNLSEPTTLRESKPDELCWYLGPQEKDLYWPALKKYLVEERKWNSTNIKSLDDASTKIISLLEPPTSAKFDIRGLVVGYVQSGKTSNYTAVITKAADVGYKLFIVLSGLTNQLRTQTQKRLSREITNLTDQSQSNWFSLTSIEKDFRAAPVGQASAFLTRNHNQKVLGVVKKNKSVLTKLSAWLKTANKTIIDNCPVLIIDDEADQASVNASGSEERTVINQLILEILDIFPKAAYIGYTATPFANVFIDPAAKDLYPKDFIVSLPKPEGYFGAERIFGRERLVLDAEDQQFEELDIIRTIPEEEIADLKPKGKNQKSSFAPDITESLKAALQYFWMATAARKYRKDSNKHSTMLIHTTLYTEVHDKFKPIVSGYKTWVYRKLKEEDPDIFEELRFQWEEEEVRMPSSEVGLVPIPFGLLQSYLLDVVLNSEIIIENSKSITRLDYDEDPQTAGKIYIVIGGNILARGLTLEGLIVSYFLRTASAYDTLLQMGRWFGYRKGYEDLPRLWMTEALSVHFRDMATVEQEIRNDIQRYEIEGVTPLDFGVRIRTHPDLAITSPMKMGAAIDAQVSFAGDFRQTILFNYQNKKWLTNNLEATKSLLKSITDRGLTSDDRQPQRIIFRDVPVDLIFVFLQQYLLHDRNRAFSTDLLRGYISAQNTKGNLYRWSVVVVTRSRRSEIDKRIIDLGLNRDVYLLNRSRLDTGATEGYADLGVIVNGYGDIVADLDVPKEQLKKTTAASLKEMRPEGSALLLLYPIDKDSEPMNGEKKNKKGVRTKLEAVEHLVGVAFAFPTIKDKNKITPQGYKTVRLPGEIEEIDELPVEEEEEELV